MSNRKNHSALVPAFLCRLINHKGARYYFRPSDTICGRCGDRLDARILQKSNRRRATYRMGRFAVAALIFAFSMIIVTPIYANDDRTQAVFRMAFGSSTFAEAAPSPGMRLLYCE
jgi:hypothetical protein